MKKLLLSLSVIISLPSIGQITNAGFETWVNNTESPHTYLVPQGWVSSDAFYSYVYNLFGNPNYVVNAVSQTPNANSGNYAVEMGVGISNNPDTSAGIIIYDPSVTHVANALINGTGTVGVPFTARPANLTGYLEFNPVGGDSAIVAVIMTKWNTSTSSRDTIVNMQGNSLGVAVPSWAAFNLTITYLLPTAPDTMTIYAGITAAGTAHPGSTFDLDDLAFTGWVGVNETVGAENRIDLFPNPFNEQTTLYVDGQGLINGSIVLYDVAGNEVKRIAGLTGNSFVIDRNGLDAGMYFYSVIDKDLVIGKGKITVQ